MRKSNIKTLSSMKAIIFIVLCKSHFLKVTTLIEMENEFFVKHDLFVLKCVHKLFIQAIAIKGSKSLSGY